MNCKNCGAPLNPTDKFCQNCGMVVDGTTNTETLNPTGNQGVSNPMVNDSVQTMNPNPNMPTPNPTMQQPMPGFNSTNGFAPKPKNNSLIMIIMGVVIAILLVIVVVLAVTGTKKEETKAPTTEEQETTTPTNTENTNTSTIYLSGYSLKIPNTYIQEYSSDGGIELYSDDVAMYLAVISNANFSQVDLNGIKANIEAEGYTVVEAKEAQYEDVNMAVFAIDLSGDRRLVAYAELPNNSVLAIELVNISGEFDYDTLENVVAPIVESAEYGSTSNSIATDDFKKNIKDFIEQK